MSNQASAVALREETGLAEVRRFAPPAVVDEQTRRLWDELFFEDAVESDVRLCVAFCEHRALDPMRGEVIFNKFEKKDSNGRRTGTYSVVPIVTAQGYRVQAERTEDYLGQTPREWCGPDGRWKEVWLEEGPPAAARVGIYRRGFPHPIYAVAVFKRFVKTYQNGDPIGVWKTNPDVMIATRAETAAFKLAFPDSRFDADQPRRRTIREVHPSTSVRTIAGAVVDVEGGEVFEDLSEAEAIAERELWVERNRQLHDLVRHLHPDDDTHGLVHDLVCGRFDVESTTEATADQLAQMVRVLQNAEPERHVDEPIDVAGADVQLAKPGKRSGVVQPDGSVVDVKTGEITQEANSDALQERTAAAIKNQAKFLNLSEDDLDRLAVATFNIPDAPSMGEFDGLLLVKLLTYARQIQNTVVTSRLDKIVADMQADPNVDFLSESQWLSERFQAKAAELEAKVAAPAGGR